MSFNKSDNLTKSSNTTHCVSAIAHGKDCNMGNGAASTCKVNVYYAAIPTVDFALDLPTTQRNEEIASCGSQEVRREKYFAWRLLLHAIGKHYGDGAIFVKQATGKWHCNLCCFSLSHGEGVVAVSVSDEQTGVDVQRVALPHNDRVLERVFSPNEATVYHQLETNKQKALYFTQKWTEKESIFKSLNQNGFLASKPAEYTHHAESKVVNIGGEAYVVSVACNALQEVIFTKVDL